jgi:hypothetical protein
MVTLFINTFSIVKDNPKISLEIWLQDFQETLLSLQGPSAEFLN